ncbi:MAG TPA: methyltransferase [Pseudonocardiaceae bacterium]|nr:methyltransferase [Pseudonocardiaceae bacterium]
MSDVQSTRIVPDAAAIRQVLGDSLGYLYPAALRTATRLGIADQLTGGPKTAAQLAELTGSHAGHLQRVLRFLATRGVFREDETGAFHLTPAADVLRADSSMSVRSTLLLLTDEIYWRCAGQLDDTVRTGTTVFNEIFGMPLFDFLHADEDRAHLFHVGIADLSNIEQDPIAAAYDFPETGRIVDVGGGPGGFLAAVLRRKPELYGVLFDQQEVLDQNRIDASLAGRWEPAAGDFFSTVPDSGDIYVLKRVLHDWDDEHSLRILKACREAMPDHAKVLVIDAVIPPGNDPHPSKLYDIAMMTIFDGKERTEDEFNELLAAAGLKPNRIIPTPGTLSIIEAVAG